MSTQLVTAALDAVAERRHQLTPGAVLVLTLLAHVARDEQGLAYPGEDYLTSRTLMHRRTVAGHLKALVDAGLIERVSAGSRGHRATYRLTFCPTRIGREDSPAFTSRLGREDTRPNREEGSEQARDSERATAVKGASSRSPSTKSTKSSTAARADEQGFHRWLRTEHDVNNPARFLAACPPARLLQLQAEFSSAVEVGLRQEQADALKCKHGVVRGYPFADDPTTGRCDTCRDSADAARVVPA